MKAISMDAIFSGFASKVDGSLSFRGTTPELTTVEKVALMDLHNKAVKLLIQPTGETPEALVEVKAPLDMPSPSARLRAVLFVEFRQKQPDENFDTYYVRRIESIISGIKSRLQPE